MSRPATFTCQWCGEAKELARTGRPPKFCSDWCRRQPVTAEQQLRQARWQKESAERTIARLEENLARYARLSQTRHSLDVGDREPGPADVPLVSVPPAVRPVSPADLGWITS